MRLRPAALALLLAGTVAAPATTTAATTTAATQAAAATEQQPPPAAPTPSTAPNGPVEMGTFSAIPAALAAALDESTLPKGTPDLVAELSRRAHEVEQMVNEGNLGQVWLPAMGTKAVALALSSHTDTLSEGQKAVATIAVKRVVMAAWELDAYGDMGNKQKMSEAYGRLASAVADLKAAYAPSH